MRPFFTTAAQSLKNRPDFTAQGGGNAFQRLAAELVLELHWHMDVRGVVFAPGGFRSVARSGLVAGWRRADRLRGGQHPQEGKTTSALPLDSREKSGTLKSVDVKVPPDQPPSTPDSPALRDLSLGLSAIGSASKPSTFFLPAQSSAAISGCGVTPPGLTY
jgi:hypothetical protein